MNQEEKENPSAVYLDDFVFIYQETAHYFGRLGFFCNEDGNFFSPIHDLAITLREEINPRRHVAIRLDYSIYPGKYTGNEALVEQYEEHVETSATEKGFEFLPARASSSHATDSERIDLRLEYWVWPVLH